MLNNYFPLWSHQKEEGVRDMIGHAKVWGTVRLVIAAALMAALLVGVVMPTSTASAAGVKVLLFHGSDSSGATLFETNLVSTGLLTADDIDIMEMTPTPPSLATLSNYDCIIVWDNGMPPSPTAQGDRLKEYVQAGGRVVLSAYALSLPLDPWKLEGGIMDDGFNPLDLTNTRQGPFPRSLNFGTAQRPHTTSWMASPTSTTEAMTTTAMLPSTRVQP